MRLMPPAAPPGVEDRPLLPAAGRGSGSRVWLVRHAQVEEAAQGIAYGNADVQLSARGLAHTLALAPEFAGLGIARVVSSPLMRALTLGRAIAEATGAKLSIDPRLRELDRGAWQGLALTEYQARWQAAAPEYWRDPLHWKGNAGESEAELRARTWLALEGALGVGDCVLSIHYQVLRSIIAAALGLAPARSHALRNDPGHISLLSDAPLGWTLVRSNIRTPKNLRPGVE